MAFTLIIGPMKSGKSLELIARVAPYEFAAKKVVLVQPTKNVREDKIQSRTGVSAKALKVSNLEQIKDDFDVIGIDEIHMFNISDTKLIKKWLKAGKEMVVSGLDLDYRAKLIPIMTKLLELKPDLIITKQAVCDMCKQYNACYSQILYKDEVVTKGLPSVVPEDGVYVYQARCRKCFNYC